MGFISRKENYLAVFIKGSKEGINFIDSDEANEKSDDLKFRADYADYTDF